MVFRRLGYLGGSLRGIMSGQNEVANNNHNKMKITILVDNRGKVERRGKVCAEWPVDSENGGGQGTEVALGTEHGLALWVESDGGKKMLVDMGASDLYALNARKLGIDVGAADYALLSHGHIDHAGGLPHLLGSHPEVKVMLSAHITPHTRYHSKRGEWHDISVPAKAFEYGSRLVAIGESRQVDEELYVIKTEQTPYSTPKGNALLTKSIDGGEESCDDFAHELSLAIKRGNGVVVVAPCSHLGALNIIDTAMKFTGAEKLLGFVGGLHLVDGYEAAEQAKELAKEWEKHHPTAALMTGHCTGSEALKVLLGQRNIVVKTFFSGATIEF